MNFGLKTTLNTLERVLLYGLVFNCFIFGVYGCATPDQAQPDSGPNTNATKQQATRETVRSDDDLEKETIQKWIKQLQSEKESERNTASKRLLTTREQKVVRAVVTQFVSGKEESTSFLLNRFRKRVRNHPEEMTYFLPPFLEAQSSFATEQSRALKKAIRSFALGDVFPLIREELRKNVRGRSSQELSRDRSYAEISRILRFLAEWKTQDLHLLIQNTLQLPRILPDSLSNEIVAVLQNQTRLYSIGTLEEWREWWNNNKGNTGAQLFRKIAVDRTDYFRKESEIVMGTFIKSLDKGEWEKVAGVLEKLNNSYVKMILMKTMEEGFSGGEEVPRIKKLLREHAQPSHLPMVRRQAIRTISALKDQTMAKGLVPLLEDYDPEIRKLVMETLRKLESSSIEETVVEQFRDEHHPEVLQGYVELVTSLGFREAVPEIKRRLRGEGPDSFSVAVSMIEALGTLNASGSVEVLQKVLDRSGRRTKEQQETIRFWTAHSLGGIGEASGVPLLVDLSRYPNENIRREAVKSLGKITFEKDENDYLKQTQNRLNEILSSDSLSASVKGTAASSLGNVGSKEMVEVLLPYVTEEDSDLQRDIRSAIQNLVRSYPETLPSVTEQLEKQKYYGLIVSILEQFPSLQKTSPDEISGDEDAEDLKDLDPSTIGKLKVSLAEAYLKNQDWRSSLETLRGGSSFIEKESFFRPLFMRLKIHRELRNFRKFFSIYDQLAAEFEEKSTQWWNLQEHLLRTEFARGKLDTVLNKKEELAVSEADSEQIQKHFRSIFQKAGALKEEGEAFLDEILALESLPGDKLQEKLQPFLDSMPRRLFLVQQLLKRIREENQKKENDSESDPKVGLSDFKKTLYADLLGRLTGKRFEEVDSEEPWQTALEDWKQWLEEQR